jgi:hypothetical protein
MNTRGGNKKIGFAFDFALLAIGCVALVFKMNAQLDSSSVSNRLNLADNHALSDTISYSDTAASIYTEGCEYCLKVTGKISIARNNNAIAIKIVADDSLEYVMQSNNATGRFVFYLPFNYSYKVVVSKPGYYDKYFTVDTRYPPRAPEVSYEINFSTEMFKTTDDLNVDVFSLPLAQIKYDEKADEFAQDEGYTKAMKDRMDKLISDYRKLQNPAADELRLAVGE